MLEVTFSSMAAAAAALQVAEDEVQGDDPMHSASVGISCLSIEMTFFLFGLPLCLLNCLIMQAKMFSIFISNRFHGPRVQRGLDLLSLDAEQLHLYVQ
jgi:hypothetical protein